MNASKVRPTSARLLHRPNTSLLGDGLISLNAYLIQKSYAFFLLFSHLNAGWKD